jgi:hypothetical protein
MLKLMRYDPTKVTVTLLRGIGVLGFLFWTMG